MLVITQVIVDPCVHISSDLCVHIPSECKSTK